MLDFLIFYDLRSSEDTNPDYDQLIEYLKSLNGCRIQKSVWVVSFDTRMNYVELSDNVKEYMNEGDSLFVCNFEDSRNYHGTPDDIKNCFNSYLGVKHIESSTPWGSKLNPSNKLTKKIADLDVKLTQLNSDLQTKSLKSD